VPSLGVLLRVVMCRDTGGQLTTLDIAWIVRNCTDQIDVSLGKRSQKVKTEAGLS
jgi:hypothetical protein